MGDASELKKSPEALLKEQPETQVELASSIETPQSAEEPKEQPKEKAEKPQEAPSRAPVQQEPVQVIQKDKVLIGIEHILAENLSDAYTMLPPDKRGEFKKRGEEIAVKVKEMVDKGHVHIRRVLRWIRDWLRMIPGVNSFFLEQEAKIKADKLLEYYKKQVGK